MAIWSMSQTERIRIQIFDRNDCYLRERNNIGHPFGLFLTPDHFIWMCDGMAGRFLKLDPKGNIVSGFPDTDVHGPEGRGDPHKLWVSNEGAIYAAEVINWRVRKFVLQSK